VNGYLFNDSDELLHLLTVNIISSLLKLGYPVGREAIATTARRGEKNALGIMGRGMGSGGIANIYI
jgi:hypothetical protein